MVDVFKYLYVHGTRIIKILEKELFDLDEAETLGRLIQNVNQYIPPSRMRQHATQPVQIAQMEYVAAPKSGVLTIKAVARNFVSRKKYDTRITFNDVKYTKHTKIDGQGLHPKEQLDLMYFTAVDGERYAVRPLYLRTHTVKVACSCLDFRWRFANYNANHGALDGDPPPPYVRKTNRPPVNPQQVPGCCKHILKTVEALMHTGLLRR